MLNLAVVRDDKKPYLNENNFLLSGETQISNRLINGMV